MSFAILNEYEIQSHCHNPRWQVSEVFMTVIFAKLLVLDIKGTSIESWQYTFIAQIHKAIE